VTIDDKNQEGANGANLKMQNAYVMAKGNTVGIYDQQNFAVK
jgi:hypothetical protein